MRRLHRETAPVPSRRVHLSDGSTYRAGPKAAEAAPKRTPEDPLRIVPERLSFRISLGVLPMVVRDVVFRALNQWCRHYQSSWGQYFYPPPAQLLYSPTASYLHSFSTTHHGFPTHTRNRSEGSKGASCPPSVSLHIS